MKRVILICVVTKFHTEHLYYRNEWPIIKCSVNKGVIIMTLILLCALIAVPVL